mgnify:CR=1 FL=1
MVKGASASDVQPVSVKVTEVPAPAVSTGAGVASTESQGPGAGWQGASPAIAEAFDHTDCSR